MNVKHLLHESPPHGTQELHIFCELVVGACQHSMLGGKVRPG